MPPAIDRSGYKNVDRAQLVRSAEIEPGEYERSRDRDVGSGAHLRLTALVVGAHRLLQPGEIAVPDGAAEPLGLGHRSGAMGVAHDVDAITETFARAGRGGSSGRGCHTPAPTRILTAVKPPRSRKPLSSVAIRLAPSRQMRKPACARGVGRRAGARPAPRAVAQNVPERQVDAADRRHGQAAPAEHGKRWPRASANGARAVALDVPQARDVAGVMADQ